jgi:hypothetical protein
VAVRSARRVAGDGGVVAFVGRMCVIVGAAFVS